MIVATHRVEEANQGLLSVLYPGWRILKEPIPMFVGEDELIVISDKVRDVFPEKTIIFITRNAESSLDSKEGMIRFLRDKGVKISPSQEEKLQALDDEEFWQRAKLATVIGSIPGIRDSEDQTSLFDLFRILFDGFEGCYRVYRKTGLPHRVIFSGLLTMMLKTQQGEHFGMSSGYLLVLDKNKTHYDLFRKHVLEYLTTGMKEKDFLTFLYLMNKRG